MSVVGRRRLLALGGAALLLPAGALAAQPQETASASPPAPAPLKIEEDPRGRMGVLVRVNGRGPFSFLVDTASERSVLSEGLASRLGLKTTGAVEVAGFAGSVVSALAEVSRLEVGGRRIDNVRLPVLPQEHLGAEGILGLDGLNRQSLGIDFQKNTLELRPGRGFAEADGDLVVRGRSRFGQLILVDSTVRRTPLFVVLDTGAEDTLGNAALRALLLARREASGIGDQRLTVRLQSVTGQTLEGERDSLPELRLGEVGLRGLPLVYAELETFRRFGLADRPALMLGMDALRAFSFVSIDFARHEVRFRLPDGEEGRG